MENQHSSKPKTFSEQEVEEIVNKAISNARPGSKVPESKKQRGFLRDPIWQFIAVLATMVGIFAAYNIFFLQRQVKSVKITVLANTSLTQVAEAVAEDIQLLYKGAPVPGLSLVQIRLENDGNVEIRSADYESPITLIFPPETTVVDASVVESEPDDLGLDMTWRDNRVILSKTLLNPQDRVILRFIVIEPSQSSLILQTNERIAGISNIPVESALSERQARPLFTVESLVIIIPTSLILTGAVMLVVYLASRRDRDFS